MNTARSKTKLLRTIALVSLLAVSVAAVLYFSFGTRGLREGKQHASAAKDDYYCPMHPNYHSDKPGKCPICEMKLVKVEKAPSADAAQKKDSQGMPGMNMGAPQAEGSPASGAPSENAIYIAPQKQQLVGMHSVPATMQPLVREIRTVGKVAYDETKVTHIHTKVSGYIEEVFADYVGKSVQKGEPLFTIYSPDLVSTEQEYLLALKSRNILKNSSFPDIATGSTNLLAATRERLHLWDVTDEEIQRLEKDGTVKHAITVYSPVNGVVTDRAAYHHGTFVDPEKDLFTIVDLSQVWVLGEVYEYELPFVRVGQLAEVDFPYAANTKTLHGRVSFVYPYLDPKTRTAQVRIEFSNPGFALKPDMFTNVRLSANLGNQLVIPQDAVLNTGTEQYVFLDLGQGYVEPRLVEAGLPTGDFYAVQKGLKPGDRVVTAANFIIDAESRLKGAFANMGKPVPVQFGQQAPAIQNLAINIIEPRQAKVGPNAVRLSVKDNTGKAIDGAEVEISLLMPKMGNMAPMTASAKLQSAGGGEYVGTVDVPMAWTWQTTVTVKRGGQTLGSAQTTLTAR
jgi:membrane fusion protein, copper/silver efflux system